MCQSVFSLNLKNTDSYRNTSKPLVRFAGETYPKSKISVMLFYSATNSYGGRIDNTATCYLRQEDQNKYLLYEVNGVKPAGFNKIKSSYMINL